MENNISHRSSERQLQFDNAYMQMAEAIGSLSYAYRKKVGAVIVSKDDQVISQGFNGTPEGWNNTCEEVVNENTGEVINYDDNPQYQHEHFALINAGHESGLSLRTKRLVLHAETNAIAKCAKFNSSTSGATLYVTLSPCIDCAKMIKQANITRVLYKEVYRDTDGLDFLKKCNISVEKIG